ncbi:putative ribonuclease H-like domain-containing protein [Tanacetum coccineum]|uniref:Ribonuclease H-like domain-containing protein n=1 Tax=Tanacetum coccineum TaxID=301880 RepID=A0ABQ5GKC5_9ASTR
MPELHNKMELLRERTGPLLRQQGPCLQIHFYLTLFGPESSLSTACYVSRTMGKGPNWLFDLDYLTDSMNYHSVRSENQANLHAGQQETNQNAGTKDKIDAGDSEKEDESAQDCFELPIWHSYSSTHPFASKSDNKIGGPREKEQVFLDDLERLQRQEKEANEEAEALRKNLEQETENLVTQAGAAKSSSTNIFSTVSTTAKASEISEALEDESWVDAMSKKNYCSFELKKFWILVDYPLWEKGYRLPDGCECGLSLWQDDERCIRVSNHAGFPRPKYPEKVYKVVKALYGLHQAPRAWYATLSTFLLKNGYRRGTIDKTLFLKKDKHDIILVQVYVDDIIFGSTKKSLDKYVAEILKKFDFASVKTASTPIETQKPLVKDEEASDVDVHLYRSMIGSLMYVTASRPDIMFAVCACSRFQVTPKTSHLSAVKRIFRYLKGKPKLGLWYPRESSFDLESYSDSDYAGANLDRKSTTGGCQFLGRRLITWQCKKQTIVATSTTEAEYVAAASCCGQVLWIQNQMLDYGFNFMNTKIYIDNESTICIVKNPVYHSKTKHIAIRHHFIRDAYEKKLIQVLKIHTDDNVADLLTKAFDVSRFQFLVVSIGMINP